MLFVMYLQNIDLQCVMDSFENLYIIINNMYFEDK